MQKGEIFHKVPQCLFCYLCIPNSTTMRTNFKIPHTFTIVLSIIVVCAVLTWIVPGGEFERQTVMVDGHVRNVVVGDSYHHVPSQPQTWQVFTAFFKGFERTANIIVFILMIGGAFWIMNETNAINKGIRMATGDYIQILNSADCLAAPDVTERMLKALEERQNPSILYGNMIKCFPDGRRMVDKCFAGQEITMIGMFTGTLNHDPAYIRRDLFGKYGYYDETLKIVSDWKWYLQAIVLGDEKPQYVDMDVTLFDMTGVSESEGSRARIKEERSKVLEELVPATYLHDYERYADDIYLMRRIHHHPWAYKLVWFIERCLFKLEKRQNKRKNKQVWG